VDNFLQLWSTSGLAQMGIGQLFMIIIGLLLLFLAIRKGFEPLLLVPIGFGGILANIPGAGLAYSAVENAVHSADPVLLAEMAGALGLAAAENTADILAAYYGSGAGEHLAVSQLALDAGYSNGMLYNFYTVAIASGVAPLVIFMGVGAMTDFGPLLANPRTLFLGAAAQFGIFATVLGARRK